MSIKILLREALISEEMFTISSLPETTALFIDKNKKSNNAYDLNLYDPENDNSYATIQISNPPNSKYFNVVNVAAEKGFGPLIYQMAMMFLSKINNKLMPTRNAEIKDGAWNVWYKFFERNDVNKHTLNIDNEEFSYLPFFDDEFEDEVERDEWFDESTPEELHKLKVFNTAYSMESNNDFNTLVSRSEKYGENTFKMAYDRGNELWVDKYS